MHIEKIEWLSSLRGVLVLLVFTSHLHLFVNFSPIFAFVLGRIGVAGFFIISGFLAVNSIENRSAKQYLFNRFLRIYPIYWLLLIVEFLLSSNPPSIIELTKNMMLVSKSMIGSSWMLPIMIFMFVCLTFIHKFKINNTFAIYILFIFSLLFGIWRWYTGKSLPTAFFLLSSLGVLSYKWKMANCSFKAVRLHFGTFELVLLISTALSYQDRYLYYFLAYNLGICVCLLFKYKNFKQEWLEFFGNIGFTFFLRAGLPLMIVSLLGFNLHYLNDLEVALLTFILVIPFSWVITRYIEQPMLSWGKKIERNL